MTASVTPATMNAAATDEAPIATAPVSVQCTPARHRDASPAPDSAPSSPGSLDSPLRELAAKRIGERSLTPYPPPLYTARVSNGTRSVTPYPMLRRWPSRDAARGLESPSSISVSSSPDKENEPFARSSAPSPSPVPSPTKMGKTDKDVRGRTLSRGSSSSSANSSFTFGVPTNTPRSLSRESDSSSASSKSSHEPVTPPMITRALSDRLLEIEVTRRCKELAEWPLLDAAAAYAGYVDDDIDLLCPPNTPVAFEAHRDWYAAPPYLSLISIVTYYGSPAERFIDEYKGNTRFNASRLYCTYNVHALINDSIPD